MNQSKMAVLFTIQLPEKAHRIGDSKGTTIPPQNSQSYPMVCGRINPASLKYQFQISKTPFIYNQIPYQQHPFLV
jgi:hypothetical protein